MTATSGAPASDVVEPVRRTGNSVVANALTIFGGQFAVKVLSFAFGVIVIRHLGSEEYGKYAVAMAFGGLFTVLSDLGLATLTVKRVASDRLAAPYLGLNVLVLRLLLASSVVGLTSIAAWLVGYSTELRLGILVATLGLVSYAFVGVADALAMGREDFRFSALLTVTVQLATLTLSALLLLSHAGFLGLLIAATVAALVVGSVALWRTHRAMPLRGPLEVRAWPSLLRAALPFAAITLALSVSYRADAVILSQFAPVAAIGAYMVAYNLVFTFTTLSHAINLALFPALMREHAAGPEDSPERFRQGLRYLLFLSLPVATFVSLSAGDLVRILYGDDLAAAGPLLAIVIWALPLMFLSEYLGYVAIVVNRDLLVARSNWIAAVANIAMNLSLIPLLGVRAAAVTTVLTEIVLVAQFLVALRHTGMLDRLSHTAGRTVLACLMLAGGVPLFGSTPIPFVALGVGAMAGYLAVGWLVGAVGRDDVRALTRITQRS